MAETMDMGSIMAAIVDPPTSDEEMPGTDDVPAMGEAPDDELVAQAEDDAVDDPEVDEGDEGDTSPTEDDALWTGLVDGEEMRVTSDAEFNKAIALGLTFGKRNRELAEKQKAFESERSATHETQQSYVAAIEVVNQFLANPAGEAPTREQYRTLEAYDQARSAWDAETAKAREFQEHYKTEQAKLGQEHQARIQQFVSEADTVTMATIPGWSDQDTAAREYREVLDYAMTQGATRQDLSNPLLSRSTPFVVGFWKAMQYDKASKAGKQTVAAVRTKAAAPGPGAETGRVQTNKQYREIKKNIAKKGGKVDDIAPVFEGIMNRTLKLQKK